MIASVARLQQRLARRRAIRIKQRRLPEIFCGFHWHNLEIGPPRGLVAIAMQVQMVISAQWYGEFVADLASERARLGKFQMMGIAGRASADKTRLGSDESKMSLVSAIWAANGANL